jgi:hypothetical protein
MVVLFIISLFRLFAKLVGDWRTALCLASILPPHNGLYDPSKPMNRTSPSY